METKKLHKKERMLAIFALRFFGDPAIQTDEVSLENLDYFSEEVIIRALEKVSMAYFVNERGKTEALKIIKMLKKEEDSNAKKT